MMRVLIKNYLRYWGPYQLAEKILFWIPKYDENFNYTPAFEKYVNGLGEFLANKTPLPKICEWIHSKRKRTIIIKTDPWDHWDASTTMAMLCLPILKDLKEQRHGIPWTKHEDGPWYFRFIQGDTDTWSTEGSYCEERWNWIMDEIIWSLEQIIDDDWESRYHHKILDTVLDEPDKDVFAKVILGSKDTSWWDREGYMKHKEKIDRGLQLLGKYWQNMWD